MMTNRIRAALALILALAAGHAACQERPARVGWLMLESSGMYSEITTRGFVKGLREAGYVEGKNLEFVSRSAQGDLRKLRQLARDIVAEKVDVFFAPAKPMADAAWYASRRVPTVIATVTDPVVVDYAVSLARPGKHITGVTTANAELIGKRMQLLTELIPGIKRIGTFIDPDLLASCEEEMRLMDQSAAKLRLTLVRLSVDAGKIDLEPGFAQARSQGVQAIITAPMTSNQDIIGKLAPLALRNGIPFMHDVPQLADQAVAVYGPDFEDIYRRAAHYVARILKGEKPAEMAIEEPREFKLIVNAKVARQLGLTVPQAMLLRADQVIE
ncbi:MAG: ABC transporter substrate-binding protein, partial [Burkholderiaceae bacterium]